MVLITVLWAFARFAVAGHVYAAGLRGEDGPKDVYRAAKAMGVLEAVHAKRETPEWWPGPISALFPVPEREYNDTIFKDIGKYITLYRHQVHSLTVIGDSYSSGDGALVGWGQGLCHRNRGSYGKRLSDILRPRYFQFLACSGATVNKVTTTQVADELHYGKPNLVLLTAGGDNGGAFFHVLLNCIMLKSEAGCDAALINAKVVADQMGRELDHLYQAIRAKPTTPDQKREIIHLGYVQMYDRDGSKEDCPGHTFWYGTDVSWPSPGVGGYRDKINKAILYVNEQIKAAAHRNKIAYVDVDPYFEGHRFCDKGAYPWMQHALTFNEDGVLCHPRWEGHTAYVNATITHLRDWRRFKSG